MEIQDTIAAVATGSGGAISVIRVSGRNAVGITAKIFRSVSGKNLAAAQGYTVHYGEIYSDGETVDEVLVTVFRAPLSYTGEDMTEISCHGSDYIKGRILELLFREGARPSQAGEFTSRAFLAGKMDLSQAEAVADIISAENRAMHDLALYQGRGGYSGEFTSLREQLLELVSLLELELDFSEEDVVFADRKRLRDILSKINEKISSLLDSFRYGNVVREGVAVSIIGNPNAGKSTLLNALVKDDRAMVSDIPGTTRDVVEESIVLDGHRYRFLDTAGIRKTSDRLEKMGIERTLATIKKSDVILLVAELSGDISGMIRDIRTLTEEIEIRPGQRLAIVLNKSDKMADEELTRVSVSLLSQLSDAVTASRIIVAAAKTGKGLDSITEFLRDYIKDQASASQTVVYNARHFDSLIKARKSLQRVESGLSCDISADLLSQDIREALHYLGLITGEITTDEILGSIFSKFCIGK